jgi:O-succinylbenzoate synthase
MGYGEIAPIPWFGSETLAEAEEICRGFTGTVSPEVLNAVPANLGCVRFALASAQAEFSPAKSAARVPVTALLPAGRGVLEALPARLEAGFISFKWKVGVGEAGDELALLDDVVAQLPGYAKLRLDANGAWDRRSASRWLARCAERPVEFVEQPLPPADADGLRGLAGDFPVTLALDESVTRLEEARRWQAEGWPGVFVIKPALAGPLAGLAAWVAETKADVVLSSAIETAVGRAAILRFALAHPEFGKRALGFGVGGVFGDRRWDGPVLGPVLDAGWVDGVNREEAWNALN